MQNARNHGMRQNELNMETFIEWELLPDEPNICSLAVQNVCWTAVTHSGPRSLLS